MINGQSAGTSLAYVFGVYLGDGCISQRKGYDLYNFKMNCIDEDFASATANALSDVLGKEVSVNRCNDSKYTKGFYYAINTSIYINGKMFIDDTQSKTIIPSYVFDWGIESKKMFIIGLMDSEGYVCKKQTIPKDCNKLTNKSYFMGFKVCMEILGTFLFCQLPPN
jgi:intein-encoded DNA endonuclease-like protein